MAGLASIFMRQTKRARTEPEDGPPPVDPRTFVVWNVNSLPKRLEYNTAAIKEFLARENPDVIGLNETWLKSAVGNQGKIKTGKGSLIPSKMDQDDREKLLLQTALAPGGVFQGYRAWFSCHASTRSSGVALLVKRAVKPPQSVKYNLDTFGDASASGGAGAAVPTHHAQGRIILAEWESLSVLLTYTPNHGSRETWARRRLWDEQLTQWCARRAASASTKPLVYIGDLNCAAEDADLSHPEWFKSQFCKDSKTNQPLPAEQAGQPGCAPIERKRFFELLAAGSLVDAFRTHNPPVPNPGPPNSPAELEWISGPRFTWRGKPKAADSDHFARYERKGMRIDHCLVSKDIADRVVTVRICGQGESAGDPSFMGSDHCPMFLALAN